MGNLYRSGTRLNLLILFVMDKNREIFRLLKGNSMPFVSQGHISIYFIKFDGISQILFHFGKGENKSKK